MDSSFLFKGPAATKVPECVFGVIDLYGQAAQATIIDLSDYRPVTSLTDGVLDAGDIMQASATPMSISGFMENGDLLRFHHLHGEKEVFSSQIEFV